MTTVYRGMWSVPNVDPIRPLVLAENANTLGVRSTGAADVETFLQGQVKWVRPRGGGGSGGWQGMSVSKAPCNLPKHRRPKGAPWNGSGSDNGGKNPMQMFQLDTDSLVPAQLVYHDDPVPTDDQHGLISPAQDMTLDNYQSYLAATVNHWSVAPAPDNPCSTTLLSGREDGSMDMPAHLGPLLDQVSTGVDPTELVTALVEANEQGASAATLTSGIEAAVARAEEAGNEEGAEALREILDRITGYCAPAFRITLQ